MTNLLLILLLPTLMMITKTNAFVAGTHDSSHTHTKHISTVESPYCFCEYRGRCGESLRTFTDLVLRQRTSQLVCGSQFELCCNPNEEWEPIKDQYAHLLPCLPDDVCKTPYGSRPTDVRDFGAVPPCPGLGAVRCLDGKVPLVVEEVAVPVVVNTPVPEGPTHVVVPIIPERTPVTAPIASPPQSQPSTVVVAPPPQSQPATVLVAPPPQPIITPVIVPPVVVPPVIVPNVVPAPIIPIAPVVPAPIVEPVVKPAIIEEKVPIVPAPVTNYGPPTPYYAPPEPVPEVVEEVPAPVPAPPPAPINPYSYLNRPSFYSRFGGNPYFGGGGFYPYYGGGSPYYGGLGFGFRKRIGFGFGGGIF